MTVCGGPDFNSCPPGREDIKTPPRGAGFHATDDGRHRDIFGGLSPFGIADGAGEGPDPEIPERASAQARKNSPLPGLAFIAGKPDMAPHCKDRGVSPAGGKSAATQPVYVLAA